ncbi:bZIP transcription factor [Hymenobacter cellulosilyticus]|uniref:BZIP transcription factor n=1 Tax=Hymenobacter cellulosilyticus TaxID=2932248 RepID=A0A8T9QBD3_9BACT|nr:bZIP transcription factor [Hymenobacter cellulosilyticus]UOQ74302.1 bZIP transcription factor [Hymenobacter cellulosilyticus]
METWLVVIVTVVVAVVYQGLKDRLKGLEQRLHQRETAHAQLLTELEQLRAQLQQLRTSVSATPPRPAPPVAAPAPATAATPVVAPVVSRPPVTPPAVPVPAAPAPAVPEAPVALPRPVLPPVAAPVPAAPVVPPVATPVIPPAPPAPPAEPKPLLQPEPQPEPRPTPQPEPKPVLPPPAPPRPVLPPVPAEPAEPTWWERTEQVLLDNWTGILGAVVLVIGVGFLGVYTALQVTAPVRFAMITGFAAALLGLNYYLRTKPFAERLHVWLQSSAAAIFLFACVGAVSVPGLQWAAPPLSYLLLLVGVAANLWLAWTSSRESVATLHGVLSLVALAVIPPDLLTLGAAAAVTAFSIAITYRQQWKYQLLLSILSFFVFHQYWHFHLAGPLLGGARLAAMSLVVLVGVAAAVVQYRRVYADSRFDALLFAAHVLNWTALGFNLYQYSTGSPWKTIPLGLGAVLTFFVARRARKLGIQWLFQTDTIISLILALATAFSLQGWHATGPVVALFMLLEALLIAFIMARERETLVFQVAAVGALLAGAGLLVMIVAQLSNYTPLELHRNALLVFLAASLGAGYFRLTYSQPLLAAEADDSATSRALHQGFGGLVGALYLGVAALLLRALFGVNIPPVGLLIAGAVAAAGIVFGLARWLRGEPAWFRTLHLAAGQILLTVAILGLHKLGLVWPATAAVLYLETLTLTWLLGRKTEVAAFRLYLGAALLAGVWLLFADLLHREALPPASLHRNAALLLAAGMVSTVFFGLLARQLWLSTQLTVSSPDRSLHQVLGGLGGALYLAGAGVILQALFGPPQPPVAALVSGATAAAGLVFGLSRWLRGQAEWFRIMHLVIGQILLTVAVLGLHKAGLSWPLTTLLLYVEFLLMLGLLAWRREWPVYRGQLYATLLVAGLLPIIGYATKELSPEYRAMLLTLAALATVGTQATLVRLAAPPYDLLPFSYNPAYRLRVGGTVAGLLLLAASGLVYQHIWAGWAALGLGAGLLLLRRAVPVPGLWVGILLAVAGTHLLQWEYAFRLTNIGTKLPFRLEPLGFGAGPTLRLVVYLLPLTLLSGLGMGSSWWPVQSHHVRWPWLYLLGVHLTFFGWVVLGPHSVALPALSWTLLAAGTALAAQMLRRRFADPEQLTRQGLPDRFLLHLTYGLLLAALLWHFAKLVPSAVLLWQVPARRITAAALVLVLAGLAWRQPPSTAPVYRSWQLIHPYLPEFTLLLLSFTLWKEVALTWQALLWLALAFALTLGAARLPERLRRVQLYGVLFFWLSTLWTSYVALRYLARASC